MPRRYRAFISYSHAADNELAEALQHALQQFAKPFYRLRAIDVFRDKTDLAASPELWPAIEAALDASDFFLIMASPRAAVSTWVKREIDHWIQTHDGAVDSIMIVLSEGDLVWGADDIDWSATTALPPLLDWEGASEGTSLEGRFASAPLFVDLRWARKQERLTARDPHFQECVATLAARLHGREKRDLIGIDVSQHNRFRRVAASAVLLLAVLAATATVLWRVASQQRKQARAAQSTAEVQRAAAQRQRDVAEARQLAAASEADWLGSPSASTEALAEATASVSLTPTYEGSVALQRMLHHLAHSVALAGCGASARLAAISRDGRTLATVQGDHAVHVCRTNGKPVATVAFPERAELVALDGAGRHVLVAARVAGTIQATTYDLPSGAATSAKLPDSKDTLDELELSDDGSALLGTAHRYNRRVWSTGGLVRVRQSGVGAFVFDVAVSPDGNDVAYNDHSASPELHLQVAGAPVRTASCPGTTLAYSPDGRLLVCASATFITVLETSGWTTKLSQYLFGTETKPLVAFTPDGNLLLLFDGAELHVWETGKFVERGRYALSSPQALAIAVTPEAKQVALLEERGVRVFSRSEVKLIERARAAFPEQERAYGAGFAFRDDDTLFVPLAHERSGGKLAKSWSTARVAAYSLLPLDEVWHTALPGIGTARALAYSPDRDLLAAGQSQGVVTLLRDGGRRAVLSETVQGTGVTISRPARFSDNERFLAVPYDVVDLEQGRLRTGSIEVWALHGASRDVIARIPGPYDDVEFDGDRLQAVRLVRRSNAKTARSVAEVDVYDKPFTGRPMTYVMTGAANDTRFQPDTRLLEAASFRPGGGVLVGNYLATQKTGATGTWQPVLRRGTLESAWSRDGHCFAATAPGVGVSVWGAKGKRLLEAEGHEGDSAVAFGPAGTFLAGDDDDATRLWRLPGTTPISRIARARSYGSVVAFSPDGAWLVRGEGNLLVAYLWRPSELVALARRQLPSPAWNLPHWP